MSDMENVGVESLTLGAGVGVITTSKSAVEVYPETIRNLEVGVDSSTDAVEEFKIGEVDTGSLKGSGLDAPSQKKPSNLASVVFTRTYARKDTGKLENWDEAIERVIAGNVRGHTVSAHEVERLRFFLSNRKMGPAGRGWWFSGAPAHEKIGGAALNNCYYLSGDNWQNFVIAQDLLMLGGGIGLSVEHRFVTHLPHVKKGTIQITHQPTKDADFIVPDSREGWNELTRRLLEAFFVTGKGFTWSSVCIRGAGEIIKGFGGVASGPAALVTMVTKIVSILSARSGKHVRPIDAMDIICCIGEMVVSGNVRRSALLILGDCFDAEYLRSKRWDLGTIPSQRAMANLSVVVNDIEDVHASFWKTYEHGEPFGIVNRKNIQKYARMGELKPDTAVGMNPCVRGEAEILTRTGYRQIKSLVGQEVEVWNGFEWSKVLPKVTGHNEQMLKVSLSSGQSLECTVAHKWVTAIGYNGRTERLRADQLKIGAKLMKADYPVVESGQECPHAYTQGFIAGDGMDEYDYFYVYNDKTSCIPFMDADYLHQDLARVVLRPNFVPNEKAFVPFEWNLKGRLDWLAGLLDSDGVELREGGVQISSVNKNFLLSVQKMLTTMGTASKVTPMHEAGERLLPDGHGAHAMYPCQDSFRLLIGALAAQQLRVMGMQTHRLKIEKSPNRDASRFVTVTAIEKVEDADTVYCFTEAKRNLGCFEGIVTGQCAEACLEDGEPCNLQELVLCNITSKEELIEAARLAHRWGKRVTCEPYHEPKLQEVVYRNRRVGTGITGCLRSPLFVPEILDEVYAAIQEENVSYSKFLGIPVSIRTTVVKPSGTISKVMDAGGYEGIHAAYSRYFIQRVRFAASDPLVATLREAGHHIEPVVRLDGTYDHGTVVIDFYEKAPEGFPVADEDWTLQKQLDVLLMAQRHWADQAVSVTVYYRREEIPFIKTWLKDNLQNLKSISFLCHSDHGFKQAPKEAITKEQYEKLSSKVRNIELNVNEVGDLIADDCEGGACPIR